MFDESSLVPILVQFLAVLYGVMVLVNLAAAWRQWRAGGGSSRRLLGVCCGFALLQILPLLTLFGLASLVDPDESRQVQLVAVMMVVGFVNYFFLLRELRPVGGGVQLLEEEVCVARVAEFSRRMGVVAPRVRVTKCDGGNPDMGAGVTGVLAPVMLLGDGVLRWYTPSERDYVLAHELGHLANGSLWILICLVPAATAVFTALAGLLVPWWVALPLGCVAWAGIFRASSRFLENDCNLRAAQIIGFSEVASALRTLYAANPWKDRGWRWTLAYASSTHPSLNAQLEALYRAAPDNERSAIKPASESTRRDRIAALACGLVAFLSIVFTLYFARNENLVSGLCAGWLLLIGSAPVLFTFWERWQISTIERRRRRTKFAWRRAIVGFGILPMIEIGIVTAMIFRAWNGYFDYAALGLLLLISINGYIVFGGKTTDLRTQIVAALEARDYLRIFELGRSAPKLVTQSPHLRHNIALAVAFSGDRARALEDLEQLRRDQPQFKMPWFTLVQLYLDGDDAARALELAEELAAALPDDFYAHILLAQAAQRVGALDRATAALVRARACGIDYGEIPATEAGIAYDQGNLPRARELVRQALRKSPGNIYALIVRAKMALQAESKYDALAAVDDALAAIRSTPYPFFTTEATRLESARSRLLESDSTS